jgi:hypothetical protein
MKLLNDSKIMLLLLAFTTGLMLTAGSTKADFTFGKPQNLGPAVNSSALDGSASVSSDGLALYFQSDRSDGLGSDDIWVVMRSSVSEPWGPAVNLGMPVNSPAAEGFPRISMDGLTLHFSDDYWSPFRPGGLGKADMWMATRASQNDPWNTPVNMGPVLNSDHGDVAPFISPDGLTLFFGSLRPGGFGISEVTGDLYMSTRPSIEAIWGSPVNLGPTINTSFHDSEPHLLPDGLVLLFMSDRPDGFGSYDLWMTTRADRDAAWRPPVNLGAFINTSSGEGSPALSADLKTLYFASNRYGGLGDWDIYEAPILPVVDLNGDGIVDAADMCIMVDNWNTDNPLCDIGPAPWGDGIVDVQDLVVLADHLFEQVNDPTLVAHWPLDETEGMFAADSVGDNDAFIVGGTAWQPSSGQVDGALQLNGVDGCAIAGPVLNPADGPFSVFAWINSGSPGQVIVSQQATADWLATDAEGNLITELKCTGRSAGPLYSETVITDGQWHRIGIVWDGSNRTLCVDGVAVTEDMQPGLQGSQMGLYIGTGKAMEPGTYFSGLIDEIRIYNRVVSP